MFISIIVCVDIWVVGAIGSHWWAGKYFTDVVSDSPSQPTGLDSIRAAFGDSFGAVNALISALAFAGVLITFFLQRYELRLQRRELEAQREEFEQQNETLALQRFENTFFHMLELHKQNVREIKVGELEGRYAFNKMIEELSKRYAKVNELMFMLRHEPRHEKNRKVLEKWSDDECDEFCMKYSYGHFFYGNGYHVTYRKDEGVKTVDGFIAKALASTIQTDTGKAPEYLTTAYSPTLGHYYRHIFQIVNFVDRQDEEILDEKSKYQYVKMLRAQMSDEEQVLFYYNALSTIGQPWVEHQTGQYSLLVKYRMIKNIPHFFRYFYKDPRVMLKDEIVALEKEHQETFFEQLEQFAVEEHQSGNK